MAALFRDVWARLDISFDDFIRTTEPRHRVAVQAMTEVGVDEIIPWAASRSVVRWQGDRGERARDRWVATAREAADATSDLATSPRDAGSTNFSSRSSRSGSGAETTGAAIIKEASSPSRAPATGWRSCPPRSGRHHPGPRRHPGAAPSPGPPPRQRPRRPR